MHLPFLTVRETFNFAYDALQPTGLPLDSAAVYQSSPRGGGGAGDDAAANQHVERGEQRHDGEVEEGAGSGGSGNCVSNTSTATEQQRKGVSLASVGAAGTVAGLPASRSGTIAYGIPSATSPGTHAPPTSSASAPLAAVAVEARPPACRPLPPDALMDVLGLRVAADTIIGRYAGPRLSIGYAKCKYQRVSCFLRSCRAIIGSAQSFVIPLQSICAGCVGRPAKARHDRGGPHSERAHPGTG